MIKTIKVPLRGTMFSFYLRWPDYKAFRKKAKERGMTAIDYINEMYVKGLINKEVQMTEKMKYECPVCGYKGFDFPCPRCGCMALLKKGLYPVKPEEV